MYLVELVFDEKRMGELSKHFMLHITIQQRSLEAHTAAAEKSEATFNDMGVGNLYDVQLIPHGQQQTLYDAARADRPLASDII